MKNNSIHINKPLLAGMLLVGMLAFSNCKRETTQSTTPNNTAVDMNSQQNTVSGRYIVVYKNNSTGMNDKFLRMNERFSKLGLRQLGTDNTVVHEGAISAIVSNISKAQLDEIRKDPNVDFIEEDKTIALSTANQSGTFNLTAQYKPWGVHAVGGPLNGVGKRVWIVDSGVELDHPDLTVDTKLSKSFLTASSGGSWSSPTDEFGHGTSVAGIIAAKNNTIGVVGIAAGATVESVRVLDRNGAGTVSQLVAGINYVYANATAGDACNISIGAGLSTSLNTAVTNLGKKGVFVSIASGNSNCNCSTCSPASVSALNVYTISGMDSNGIWVVNSNYGSAVKYCEPGKYITSTWIGKAYRNGSGTSLAAPHMTGILLMTGGKPKFTTYVKNDPDLNPAPIGHLSERP